MSAKVIMKTICAAVVAGCLILLYQSSLISACETATIKTAASPGSHSVASLDSSQCPNQDEPELVLRMVEKDHPTKWRSVVIATTVPMNVDLLWLSERKLAIFHPATFKLSQTPTEISGVSLTFRVH
jgi:hypothetical protein